MLEVRYHGKNIHEVLQLTVKEGAAVLLCCAQDDARNCEYWMRSVSATCGLANRRRRSPAARPSA